MRTAARKDNIHGAVVNVWEQCGWACMDLSQLGNGKPDILAVRRSFAVLIETQDPRWKSNKKPETLEAQAKFRETWKACPVLVIETVEQAWKEAEILREVGS